MSRSTCDATSSHKHAVVESSGSVLTYPPLCSGKEHTMRGHTRTGLRIGAYVASGALALSGAVLAVTPAQASRTTRCRPTRQRTGWPVSSTAG